MTEAGSSAERGLLLKSLKTFLSLQLTIRVTNALPSLPPTRCHGLRPTQGYAYKIHHVGAAKSAVNFKSNSMQICPKFTGAMLHPIVCVAYTVSMIILLFRIALNHMYVEIKSSKNLADSFFFF